MMKLNMRGRGKLQRLNNSGIVSIMVTMVMMLVISLIILGLAQVARREQRESIDNQLTAQAFYAAESGVNDVVSLGQTNPSSLKNKTDCGPNAQGYNLDKEIDSTANIEYTCLLITTDPTQLNKDLRVGVPQTFNIQVKSGSVDALTIKWTKADGSSQPVEGCPSTSSIINNSAVYTPSDGWQCPYGMLRIDLLPASATTRDEMVNGTMTLFVAPSSDANQSDASTAYLSSKKGYKYPGFCTAPGLSAQN